MWFFVLNILIKRDSLLLHSVPSKKGKKQENVCFDAICFNVVKVLSGSQKKILRIVALGHILDLWYRMILIDVHIFTEQSKGNNSSFWRNSCKDYVPFFFFIYIYMKVDSSMCIYIYIYIICMCVSICIYIHTLPDTIAT